MVLPNLLTQVDDRYYFSAYRCLDIITTTMTDGYITLFLSIVVSRLRAARLCKSLLIINVDTCYE